VDRVDAGRSLPGLRERDPAASLVLRTVPDPVLRSVCAPVDAFQHEVDHLNGRLICDHAAVAGEPGGAGR
jgi:hypothetical protein